MAGNMKEEILEKAFKLKEENDSIKGEVFPYPSIVEDICTVYVQGEVKPEFTEIEGNV